MLVSVITAVRNGRPLLEKTIHSVLNQTHSSIEHVIIDGGSTDGTVELLKAQGDKIHWVSEKDRGISDAFNKGVKMSRGEYVVFLGAGDYFASDTVVEQMLGGLGNARPALISGKINRVDDSGRVLWTSPRTFTPVFRKTSLLFRMPLPHQALFTHRRFFEKYGPFDLNCKFSMDYDLLLRAYHSFPEVLLKDVLVSAWLAGGVGQGRIIELLKEYHAIKIKNKVAPPTVLSVINAWTQLKFFIKGPLA